MKEDDVNRLIRELARIRREATEDEKRKIVERLATAEFAGRYARVDPELRGENYLGRLAGDREDSLFAHLLRRVRKDRQWAEGTTEAQYVADLRAAARHPDARIFLYERRGGVFAAILAPNTVPAERRGALGRPFVFVAYSADWGKITTGYQTAGRSNLSIGEALWLK